MLMGMEPTPRSLIAILVLATTIFDRAQSKPPTWSHCTSNLECNPGYCCRMSFERYSIPTCEPILKEGESCKPGEPFIMNGTRGYPDGTTIELEDVFVMFCPCAIGLTCDRDNFACRDASEMKSFNHLTDHSNKKDD